MEPLGNAAKVSTTAELSARMVGEYGADSVLFGGVLGCLDLHDCARPVGQLDLGRMRGAAQTLDQDRSFRQVFE